MQDVPHNLIESLMVREGTMSTLMRKEPAACGAGACGQGVKEPNRGEGQGVWDQSAEVSCQKGGKSAEGSV